METSKTYDEFIARQVQAVLAGERVDTDRNPPALLKHKSAAAIGADISGWPELVERWVFSDPTSFVGGPYEAWFVDPAAKVVVFYKKMR